MLISACPDHGFKHCAQRVGLQRRGPLPLATCCCTTVLGIGTPSADVPLPDNRDDRARALARILELALARLRAIRPADYERLAPASTFRVPLPPGDDTQA